MANQVKLRDSGDSHTALAVKTALEQTKRLRRLVESRDALLAATRENASHPEVRAEVRRGRR